MKRFVPCFLALLLLLTACSGPEGPAGNPSGDPEPTPVAQGHALPKDNRDAAGTGSVFTDDNGWYICAAGAVSYYDYASGQTMTLSVGQRSANYDYVVPNSAIREDNNGKFILIVESKSSPLGNRYIATRVDVEVLASDDTMSAISGGLYGYEYVITTSTAPVEVVITYS